MNYSRLLNILQAVFATKQLRQLSATLGHILIIILFLAFIPVLMQYLHLGSWHDTIVWTNTFTSSFRVNIGIVALLFTLLYVLLNSSLYALVATLFFCGLFTIIDLQKMRILNQPLLPGDLLFIKQALLVVRMYAQQAITGIIAFAIFIILLFLTHRKIPNIPLPLPVRGAVFTLIVASIAYTSQNYQKVINTINGRLSIVNEYWNQVTNFEKNGVLYAFFMNLESLSIPRPPDYSVQSINKIFSAFPDDSIASGMHSEKQPDVIVYMSESFWDITQVAPSPLSRDPIPFFRKQIRKKQSVQLLSPVFGGNTCNAEFEVLTGMSHGFFPPGVMAYNQFIQHPVPSIVKVFKDNGYQTTAIHTFKQWFWNRVNVYRQLGFDSFISVENMDNPQNKGFYIADKELSKHVINQASSKQRPDFIFALSMQNHGPYNLKRYDTLDCPTVTGLSQAADLEFNTYVQGLIDADASLKAIAHYIDTVHQPTLLLFFGDHLPGFTHYYNETGIAKRIERDTLWARTTKAVWYANYPLYKSGDSLVSMMYIPLLVAKQAHISVPAYYHYLDTIFSHFPVFSSGRPQRPDSMATDSLFSIRKNECSLCVYDALLGKRYTERYHRLQRH